MKIHLFALLLMVVPSLLNAEESYAPVSVDITPVKVSERVWYVPGQAGTATDFEGFISNAGFVVTDESDRMTISLNSDPDKTKVVQLIDPAEAMEAPAVSTELKYHVIGGCFSIRSNADGLVASYQNYGNNASIIDERNGLFRVSVGSFATKKEAQVALASLRNAIPGAWLLYK